MRTEKNIGRQEDCTVTETKQNILRLEALLPKAKGKVMAVLWMTVLSAVLMVGSTFAWVTLSTNPEVSGVETTVTGNGSLEIALSGADGEEPETSAVGDSSSSQDVTLANQTWGNLVSLSDSSYGLDNLTLYPSRLNTSSLRTNPLMSVDYGTDGRITTLNNALWYTIWDADYRYWQVSGEYGVRAVATVETTSTGEADLATLRAAAQTKLAEAEDAYAAVVSSEKGYMSTLVAMVGDYLDYKLNGGDAHDYADYTGDIYNMYVDLSAAADTLGEAYVATAEIYQYSIYGAEEGEKLYTPWTLDELKEKTEAEWEAEGVTLTGWDDYLALVKSLNTYTAQMLTIYNSALAGNSVSWSTLQPKLAALFPYSTATYTRSTYSTEYSWSQLMSASTAILFINFAGDSESSISRHTANVHLTDGLLYDFEEMLGYSMTTGRLEVHFTYQKYFSDSDLFIAMVVSTTSSNDYVSDAISAAPEDTDAGLGSSTADETYGMAVDLWVRTNAEGTSYLFLDGATVTDSSGNVIGYEGSNRIWTEYDDSTIYGTSATQGSGSCYVFYYSSAEELTNILNMIKQMKVVFFDTHAGTKLATASFDTDNYYENSAGRVTVPLVVDHTDANVYSVVTGTQEVEVFDDSGEPVVDINGDPVTETVEVSEYTYYITALEQNEAVSITALLYVDGTGVTNADATVAENLTGKLNLQFASSETLTTAGSENSDLYNESVQLTAEADVTEHTWGMDDDNQTTVVTLTVEGSTPSTVTAAYGRQVNSGSQALKQETVSLMQSTEDESVWTMTYEFPSAGTYVLTHVTLDGAEHELEEAVTVTVAGLTLNAVSWDYTSTSQTVFTADSSVSVPVTVNFASEYTGDSTVRAAFVSSSGKYIYATLTSADGQAWTGNATITASGTYTLKYFYVGSDIYDIPEAMQRTLTTYMGLRTTVRLSSADFDEGTTQITYEDGETYTVSVSVTVTDNSGSVLRNIAGTGGLAEGSEIKLRYAKTGSSTEYLEAGLTWSSTSGSYTGQFEVSGIGVYSFSYLSIGDQSVTSSTSAPSLVSAYYVEAEPEYAANLTETTQTVIGGKGSFYVQMLNADVGWAIKAVIKNVDNVTVDELYTLSGEITASDADSGLTTWTFAAVDENGAALEGNFQLMELQLYPVTYDSNGKGTEGEQSGAINTEDEAITAKIVTTVYITETYGLADESVGTETTAYTGASVTAESGITLTGSKATSISSVTSTTAASSNFYAVASYDLGELTVVLEDFEGEVVEGLAVTDLEYELDADTTADYGYTIVYNEAQAPLTATLAADESADGTTYTFGEDAIGFNLWGEYDATLTYTVGDAGYQVSLAPLIYETGDLPKLGNSSGTLKHSNASSAVSTSTTLTDGSTYFNYTGTTEKVSFTTTDEGDFEWTAKFGMSMSGNLNTKLVTKLNGWYLPKGYVQMYAQNIYISSDAPAVWLTAEDGLVSDDGTVTGDYLTLGSSNYTYMRNFTYTSAITSAGRIYDNKYNGYTNYGMIIGEVSGDTESTKSLTNVTGLEKTLLGTYDTVEEPVYNYSTDEYVTYTNGTYGTTTDPEDENILYQTVITNYEPVVIDEIYIQYHGVTYKVDLSNKLTISNPY
ncbi:MAG: hypothetical protein LUE90_09475 [Clostridiales bacterium]|nr:hypothetical protein [Clostridiales bacterium]